MPCLLPRTSARSRRPPSARLRNLFRPCATHERNYEQFSPSSEGPRLSVCDGTLALQGRAYSSLLNGEARELRGSINLKFES